MPDTGLKASPQLQKAALVQVSPVITGITTRVVAFQYNPKLLKHELKPWNPFDADQTQRGSKSPTVQPYDPEESYTLRIELDAADELEDDVPFVRRNGIQGRIAALEQLTLPEDNIGAQLLSSAASLLGADIPDAFRASVPVLIFTWGPGRLLPVRITSFSVEETSFSPTLHPLQATVDLGLQVMTPDSFRCHPGITAAVATTAYKAHRVRQNVLATTHVVTDSDSIRALLPI